MTQERLGTCEAVGPEFYPYHYDQHPQREDCVKWRPAGAQPPKDGIGGNAPEPNSREEYEKTLAYAERNNYRAMYNAMQEDGYDPTVDWASLRKDVKED